VPELQNQNLKLVIHISNYHLRSTLSYQDRQNLPSPEMSSPVLAPKVSFILQIKVTIDPKDRTTFLEHFKPVYEAVVNEPECAYFFIGENAQEPGVFRWTEGWTKDVNWFMTVSSVALLNMFGSLGCRGGSKRDPRMKSRDQEMLTLGPESNYEGIL